METRNCSKCGEPKPVSDFQIRNGKPSGQCRACKTASMKALRAAKGVAVRKQSVIVDGQKLCMKCDTMKPLEEFSSSKRGLGGVSAWCKPCAKLHARQADKAVV